MTEMSSAIIVIPCLNEERHIGGLLAQLRPAARRLGARIIVADGGSRDATRTIVAAITAEDANVVLIDNPARIQSAAVNLAVELCGDGTDYLIRIDAHGGYPDDYCDRLLEEALDSCHWSSTSNSVRRSRRSELPWETQRWFAICGCRSRSGCAGLPGSSHTGPANDATARDGQDQDEETEMSERIGTMKKVRKAVIPVAGLGTRFLPATKSMPKEMLPVVDRPVVQYAVDEALEAGIEHIVFVTGRNKAVIEDYFDLHPELVGTLEQAGKVEQIKSLERLLPAPGATSFTRQQAPHGLGHAVWCARDIIGDEPFALLLPDMVSFGKRGCLAEIMDLHAETGGNVIAVEQCDPIETNKYGIVGKGPDVGSGFEVTAMVEKPAPANAPSNFYINGRYILQPEIFNLLGTQKRGAGGEIQLTDAMVRLATSQAFFARPFNGRMFDCGSKEGFIQANVAFALKRADIRDSVLDAIREMVAEHDHVAAA